MNAKTWQRRHFLTTLGTATVASSALLRSAWAATTQAGGGVQMVAPSELRPGMKGYGLTVVRGTKPERFEVEVIGVLKHAMPKQDLVLIRCAGLGLEHAGIVAGMSGSPVFVVDPALGGERLVGAVSYGFQFNKDPVGGVTSILDMLPEMDRKLLPVPSNQIIRLSDAAPPFRAPVHVPGMGDMMPVTLPMTVSGVHPDVLAEVRAEWASLGFPHLSPAAGTSGVAGGQVPKLEPGGAISVALARGDISMAAVGTVTWVRGDRFVAFGHPFKGLGQLHLPVGGADVQWILASQASSFKMANSFGDAGVMDQDRQPAIAGRIGPKAEMIPMDVRVTSRGRQETTTWHVELTDQPTFFPLLVNMVMGTVVRVSEPTAENAAITMNIRFDVDGHAPIEVVDTMSGLQGAANVGDLGALAQNAAKAIVFNGFERLRVRKIEAMLTVADERNIAFLESARVQSEEVDAETAVSIQVAVQVANAGTHKLTLTLPPLPRDLMGQTVTVQIGAEKAMAVELPEPANIRDYLNALRKTVPRNRLAAVVTLPEPTVLLRGARLTQLPLSARDELAGHSVTYRAGKDTLRAHVDTPWTLNGSLSVKLRVRQTP